MSNNLESLINRWERQQDLAFPLRGNGSEPVVAELDSRMAGTLRMLLFGGLSRAQLKMVIEQAQQELFDFEDIQAEVTSEERNYLFGWIDLLKDAVAELSPPETLK